MKKIVALLLAVVLAVSLCACTAAGQPKETTGGAEKIQFSVIVVHQDATEQIFLFEAEEGAKLGAILEEDGLIDSEGADQGMFHTVDGEKADWNKNQSYWAFYVDNEYAMTGIYDTPVENGQNYKLVYTIG